MSGRAGVGDSFLSTGLPIVSAVVAGGFALASLLVSDAGTQQVPPDGNTRWQHAETYEVGEHTRILEVHRAVDGFDLVCVVHELPYNWGQEARMDCVPGRGAFTLQREESDPGR